jgi:aerobic C4-dicarboxylate transport protein
MVRATVNMLGNGVATLVIARWERELDGRVLRENLDKESELAIAVGA